MLRLQRIDGPIPKRKRLGVWIVDAENLYAALDPIFEHAAQLTPQTARIFAVEIERIDVLIFLRRILRVLDRPVRPGFEPLGMFADVRVIGCSLKRDVERDLDAQVAGALE